MPPSARAAVLLRRVSATAAYTAAIKRRVEGVEILAVQMILCDAERIGETIKGEWILRYPFFLNFPFDVQTVLGCVDTLNQTVHNRDFIADG